MFAFGYLLCGIKAGESSIGLPNFLPLSLRVKMECTQHNKKTYLSTVQWDGQAVCRDPSWRSSDLQPHLVSKVNTNKHSKIVQNFELLNYWKISWEAPSKVATKVPSEHTSMYTCTYVCTYTYVFCIKIRSKIVMYYWNCDAINMCEFERYIFTFNIHIKAEHAKKIL